MGSTAHISRKGLLLRVINVIAEITALIPERNIGLVAVILLQ